MSRPDPRRQAAAVAASAAFAGAVDLSALKARVTAPPAPASPDSLNPTSFFTTRPPPRCRILMTTSWPTKSSFRNPCFIKVVGPALSTSHVTTLLSAFVTST